MSSPAAAPRGVSACRPEPGPAPEVRRLKRRQEFLDARRGPRWVGQAFVIQTGRRPAVDDAAAIGLGFTVSRRVGNAVARNRARRRLREAARAVLPGPASPGLNYVIVARSAALTCPYDRLLHDLRQGLSHLTRKAGARGEGRAS